MVHSVRRALEVFDSAYMKAWYSGAHEDKLESNRLRDSLVEEVEDFKILSIDPLSAQFE